MDNTIDAQAQAAPQPVQATTPSSPAPVAQGASTQSAPATPQTAPAQPAVKPGTPHAGLLNMIQSLALGVDSFATAAATKGREGGVPEVQAVQAQQQQQKIQAQQAQQEQSEHDLRLKTMNANLLMQQMNYQHSMMRFPLEMKNDQLGLQNNTIDEFTKEKSTGESMGYDMADPAQAQEARFRMGLGSADQQPGAISVPFAANQNTGDVMKALTAALPPGKSLTDYKIMPSYTDDQHGTGGKLIAVPNDSPLMTMPATPRQIAASNAEVQGMIEKAKATGLSDSDQFKSLEGQFDNIKQVLANGGKPTTSQLFQMHQSIAGPLGKMVADKSDAAKLQEQQETLQKETIAGQQLRAANNAYAKQVPRDAQGNPTESFQTWQAAQQKAIEQSITAGDPKVAGQALASGIITLSDLKSRGSNPAQILAAINAAQHIDPKYNPSDEVVGEQILKNATSQTFFGSARSLTQSGGVLDQLLTAHSKLAGTPVPKFNTVANLIAWHAGSPGQAAYKAALLGAADDAAKVMGGGTPTDALRDATVKTFSADLSPAGINAAVEQTRSAVRSQVDGRIGGNRYVRQREGDIVAGTGGEGGAQQPQQTTQPKPTPQPPQAQPTAFQKFSSDGKWGWSGTKWLPTGR